jgi:hypothetical protein
MTKEIVTDDEIETARLSLSTEWMKFSQAGPGIQSGLGDFEQNLRQPLRVVDHHVVAAWHFISAPRWISLHTRERFFE